MFIKPKDVITLEDNDEYVVVAQVDFENKLYSYIVDINNNDKFKFCYIEDDVLVEVNDGSLIKKILPLFQLPSK